MWTLFDDMVSLLEGHGEASESATEPCWLIAGVEVEPSALPRLGVCFPMQVSMTTPVLTGLA